MQMIRRNVSNNKCGSTTVAIVAVIILIAAVAAAGAYVLLKDGKDDGANETVIEGKMGAGTVLYYDPMISALSVTAVSGTVSVTGKLLGESGTHYFFEYGDGIDISFMVKIHKETGAVDSASESNGKWTFEITNESGDVIKAEMTIGQLGNYGNVVSTVSVVVNGEKAFAASIRSSGHNIVGPSEYKRSEQFGKYVKYDLSYVMTTTILSIGSYEDTVTGYTKISVVGTAADNMLIVLVEGEIKMTFGLYSGGDKEYSFKEYRASADIKENITEIPEGMLNLVDKGIKSITVAGKSVQAKEYSFSMVLDGVALSGKMYYSLDDSVVYLYEVEGTGSALGSSVSIVMTVKYAEGNL